jgi:hypothetical protein
MYCNSFVPILPRFPHGWQPTGQRERYFVMAVRMGLFAAFPRERPRSGCPSARVSPRRLTCATAHICLEGLVTQTYTKPKRVATETSKRAQSCSILGLWFFIPAGLEARTLKASERNTRIFSLPRVPARSRVPPMAVPMTDTLEFGTYGPKKTKNTRLKRRVKHRKPVV